MPGAKPEIMDKEVTKRDTAIMRNNMSTLKPPSEAHPKTNILSAVPANTGLANTLL
ncbi:hypothetical protein M404DRAFT_991342 [Pisolithus tinctorius Marx 270]|uniref:Uncharacterized protein n=1 Tax=Pisolithus tinctorius Marx 270 TaxID=870435 RepID=A0A0C3PZ24_PISTI|nr:hypothetical protein M404DRAFT_991342 [Pisolithus tinctorius Marx 270]